MEIKVRIRHSDSWFGMTMVSATPVLKDGEINTYVVCYDEIGDLHTFKSDVVQVIVPEADE